MSLLLPGMTPSVSLSWTLISQLAELDLKDPLGHQVPVQDRQRLVRFLKYEMMSLRYRRAFHSTRHTIVSDSVMYTIFLCYLLFHSERPSALLEDTGPAAVCVHTQQMSDMLKGTCKQLAQALNYKTFRNNSAKLAQSMVYPQHIWDQRNFSSCFQAMLDHMKLQVTAHGTWTLQEPWGHWQHTAAYASHLRSSSLGIVGGRPGHHAEPQHPS